MINMLNEILMHEVVAAPLWKWLFGAPFMVVWVWFWWWIIFFHPDAFKERDPEWK